MRTRSRAATGAVLGAAMLVMAGTVTTTTAPNADARPSCYYRHVHMDQNSRWGFTAATADMTLHWCDDGHRITSVEITQAGGETSTPGQRYEGIGNQGTKIVANKAVGFTEFEYSISGRDLFNWVPGTRYRACIKIIGEVGGASSHVYGMNGSNRCNRF